MIPGQSLLVAALLLAAVMILADVFTKD